MAAFDLNVRRLPLLANTQGPGAAGLAKFIDVERQRRESREKNALVEQRLGLSSRIQDYQEGAPDREREAALALNQAMLGAASGARGDLQFTPDQANLDALRATASYQALSPDEQQAYERDTTERMRSNPMFSDPKQFEQLLRARYANTSASPTQIDTAVAREMASAYNTLNPDIFKAIVPKTGGGSSFTGLGNLFGGNGSRSSKTGSVNDSNFNNNEEFVQEVMSRYGVDSGSGTWYNNIFDPGNPDMTEVGIAQYRAFMAENGISDSASISALDVIREDDTTSVSMTDLINANRDGTTKADKALDKVMSRAEASQRIERRNANPGGNGMTAGNQDKLMQIIRDAAQGDRNRQDQLLSQLSPRAATREQRREFWLRDHKAAPVRAAPPAPAPAPQTIADDNIADSPTTSSVTQMVADVVSGNPAGLPKDVSPPGETRQREQAGYRAVFPKKDETRLKYLQSQLRKGGHSVKLNRLRQQIKTLENQQDEADLAQRLSNSSDGAVRLSTRKRGDTEQLLGGLTQLLR